MTQVEADCHCSSTDYLLGHAPDEQVRLMRQARFIEQLTEPLFRSAGLCAGQRVLDLGCGVGDVSFLAASIVGPTGQVIGVNKSSEAIATASARAHFAGISNVWFIQHDLLDIDTLPLSAPMDAVVGRLVLMYLPDPAVVLRRLLQRIRPGGLIVFQEGDFHTARIEPLCPLFAMTTGRILQTFARVGIDTRLGLRLAQIFELAGLPTPQMIESARVERGPGTWFYEWLAATARTLLPAMERNGVASAHEVNVETLADRLRDEATRRGATLVSPAFIGAWARV